MKHLKRKRKSNYSVKETQTLIREIHKRREILFSRQQNMAINELKRRAWEEVADSVNALGEGELRTAAEVKRRYLDWRALMKRKQLQAELASGLKQEFEASSPDNDASLGGGDQSLDLSGFSKDSSCDWQDLTDLGEPSTHTPGVKMEDDEASSYRVCTRHRYYLYSFHQIVGILGSWVILTHGGHKSLSIWMLQTVQFGCFCLTEINFIFCKDALN